MWVFCFVLRYWLTWVISAVRSYCTLGNVICGICLFAMEFDRMMQAIDPNFRQETVVPTHNDCMVITCCILCNAQISCCCLKISLLDASRYNEMQFSMSLMECKNKSSLTYWLRGCAFLPSNYSLQHQPGWESLPKTAKAAKDYCKWLQWSTGNLFLKLLR